MATNKSFQRFGRVILAAVMTITAVVPAHAGDWMPMLPDQDFYDFQLFAPPDLQEYEMYPEQSEGIFFNYDRLYWGITPPRVTGVAESERGGYLIPVDPISPQSIVQLNDWWQRDRRRLHLWCRSAAARSQHELDADSHDLGQSVRGRLDLRQPRRTDLLLQ